jgi:hypothetical protein
MLVIVLVLPSLVMVVTYSTISVEVLKVIKRRGALEETHIPVER